MKNTLSKSIGRFVTRAIALLFGLMLAADLAGCVSTDEEGGKVDRSSGTATIRMSGNTQGGTLIVDDLISVQVTDPNGRVQFNLAPGNHTLRLIRNGAVAFERSISLKDGQTLKLTVP